MQREHYVPLKVIREHLQQIDRGLTPPDAGVKPTRVRMARTAAPPSPPAAAAGAQKQPLRLSRPELIEASGLTEATFTELERTQIVLPRHGTSTTGATS